MFTAIPKIVTSYRPKSNSFCYVEKEFYSGTDTYYILNAHKYNLIFVLGIINSKLSEFWLKRKGKVKGNALELTGDTIETLRIPMHCATNELHMESINTTVSKILTITKDEDYAQNPQKQARVKELEREIDQMVYQLYGLTEEEIRIVEGEGK